MVELSFHSNACSCCGNDSIDCGCTFPCNQDVQRLERQIKRLKAKLLSNSQVKKE